MVCQQRIHNSKKLKKNKEVRNNRFSICRSIWRCWWVLFLPKIFRSFLWSKVRYHSESSGQQREGSPPPSGETWTRLKSWIGLSSITMYPMSNYYWLNVLGLISLQYNTTWGVTATWTRSKGWIGSFSKTILVFFFFFLFFVGLWSWSADKLHVHPKLWSWIL